jgi:hypothetical protein
MAYEKCETCLSSVLPIFPPRLASKWYCKITRRHGYKVTVTSWRRDVTVPFRYTCLHRLLLVLLRVSWEEKFRQLNDCQFLKYGYDIWSRCVQGQNHPLRASFHFNPKGEIVRKFQICPKPVLETAIRDVTRMLFKEFLEKRYSLVFW